MKCPNCGNPSSNSTYRGPYDEAWGCQAILEKDNSVSYICMDCGYRFKPEEVKKVK